RQRLRDRPGVDRRGLRDRRVQPVDRSRPRLPGNGRGDAGGCPHREAHVSTTRSPETSESIDYSRKWLVMAAVVAGILLATIDSSIVNIAIPTMVLDLVTTFHSHPTQSYA